MRLTLQRTHETAIGDGTFGELREVDALICYTLEDKVREQEGVPVSEWKIHGQTAIPSGLYRVTLENSPRFGPNCLTIHRVPGFTGIRMHGGNTAADTEGCPLLGLKIDANGIVGGTSRPAVKIVQTAVQGAIDEGEEVWIQIANIPE